jgi:UDP-2,3-diacylglucosamine pyrophosphatase LpxH
MGETKPRIIVVSDVHLGSLDSEIDLFTQFLRNIINGEFGNELQALIIMGDFIDLCTDVPFKILKDKKIQEVLKLLIKIKENIKIVFLLGNHEIPVTRDYDEKFKRRKDKFLRKFQNSNFQEIFDNSLYYQYILFKKWNNEDTLLLYDTRDQIYHTPITQIKINDVDLAGDYECLMTHGYQFDSEIYRFFVGQLWKSLINNDKYEVKETYDYFWNEVIKNGRKIKPITFKQMKEDLANLKEITLTKVDLLFSELNTLEFNLIKANMRVMKKWERASNPDYYLNEIKKFLEDDDFNFSKINHVIYGHSHHKERTQRAINNKQVEIINDGSWQHVQPTYVEIHYKGRMNLKTFNGNYPI